MLTLNLHLPKEVENELEKDLKWLEKTTKQPREYHIKEKKGQVKYYTSEEVKERLERLKKSEK